jgi:hypothetical protein
MYSAVKGISAVIPFNAGAFRRQACICKANVGVGQLEDLKVSDEFSVLQVPKILLCVCEGDQ